jgi:nitrite reductase/ring-hydroxylating ferredoxin subunit
MSVLDLEHAITAAPEVVPLTPTLRCRGGVVSSLMALRSYPEGWFRVAAEADLPRGAVRPLRVFGRELVLFHTRAGQISAVDAYCPHAGAHLGYGGTVEGEALRCPFHGLRWSVDGRCVDDHGRDRSALATWPLQRWQGQLMVFASADRRAPDWPLPSLAPGHFCAPRWRTLRLRGHVQDVAENGVDFRHFVTVHRYSNLREPRVEFDGVRLHSRFGFDRVNPISARLGTVSAVFDTDIWGLGCSITDLQLAPLGLHFRLLLLATQIDDVELEFTIGLSLERPALARGFGRALFDTAAAALHRYMLSTIIGDVLQDEQIWAHRQWLARPALTPEDRPIVAFRRYAERFYRNGV